MIDFHPLEAEESIKKVLAMDWDRLIPGHPDSDGRLGTKQDAQDQLTLLQEASAEMKKLGQEGKCWDTAEKEFKLPKYATWPGYDQGLPFGGPVLPRVERFFAGGDTTIRGFELDRARSEVLRSEPASDLRFRRGVDSPTLLVPEMVVASG